MTWQRINENTFIDDSLVTCAEYQLFIDEMLEQGKYYQPDHWTSEKFPDGNAHHPILGVRYTDAKSFCEWLSQKEATEWVYRLPKGSEDDEFGVYTELPSFGIWKDRDQEKFTLSCAGINPGDFLDISSIHFHLKELLVELPKEYYETFFTDATIKQHSIINLSYALRSAAHLKTGRLVAAASKSAPLKQNIDNLISNLDRSNQRNIKTAAALSSYVLKDIISSYKVAKMFSEGKGYWEILSENLNKMALIARSLLLDILVLDERIAKRSPAFESILLVKERMR